MAKIVTLDLLRVFLENLKTSFTAPHAKIADVPDGFTGKLDKSSLGNQDGNCITEWYSSSGANIAFRDVDGSVNVVTSGHFYSGGGEHVVLDSENYKKYLPVGDDSGSSDDSGSGSDFGSSGEGGTTTTNVWNISIAGKASKADVAEKAVRDDLGRKISETYVSMAGGAIQGDLHVSGDIYANRVHNAIYNDYAEFFEKGDDKVEPGDIIALDESADEEQYVRATKDSNVVVGICSDEYGQIIGGTPSKLINQMNYIPVALMGRVHVKVTGYVKPGDRIVISDTLPGVGMADDGSGRKPLGIALTSKKDGKVRILVNQEH